MENIKESYENIIGSKFNRWNVLGPIRKKHNGKGPKEVFCECECGTRQWIQCNGLRNGQSKGCRKCRSFWKKHGMYGTKYYQAWAAMHDRCSNPNNSAYKNYGGRGIEVCQRWFEFENYLADMGPRPPGKTLDRIDNNGPYSADNCRWANWREQSGNKRQSRIYDFNGKKMCLTHIAEQIGMNPKTLDYRLSVQKLSLEYIIKNHRSLKNRHLR